MLIDNDALFMPSLCEVTNYNNLLLQQLTHCVTWTDIL